MSYTNSPYKTISKAWGLYQKDDNKAIPLKSLHISVQIVHNIARVFYTQEYYNDSNAALETEFFFPISPDACFDSFQAKFNDTTITGIVKQKQQAQEEYKQAINNGTISAYSEINPDTGDIMKVLIGNIPSKSPVSITYSYVEKLTVSLNKFWYFRLFSSITPRYNGSLSDLLKADVALLAAYPTISDKSSTAYPWYIDVEIQSPSAISIVESPSHSIVRKYGNESHTCTVTLDDSSTSRTPSKDFVLLFSNDTTEQVESVLTPFEGGYCAMVSIMANFDQTGYEDTYENFVTAKEIKERHAIIEVRGEYIFLIDRSASMSGERINMAKNSLTLFLKSLPKDSLFNVASFGSNYSLMYDKSVQTSKESIEVSYKKVQSFGADMGGTEIHECLKSIFDQPLRIDYPRFVFLLTDGDISNTREVLHLVKSNNNKAQVFSVGIGSGCSAELITKTAYYGRGKHEFVVDNKEIYEKVISLLDSSFSPCFSDFSFHADNFDAVVKSVSPNPTTVPFLLNGQTATYFLFLRKEAFSGAATHKMKMSLRMYDSRIRNHRTVELVLNDEDIVENEMIVKLGIHSMIQGLESQKEELLDGMQNVLWRQEDEIKSTLLDLSIKYGILCQDTAFICEVKQKDQVLIQQGGKIKFTVPAVKRKIDDDIDLFCDDSDDESQIKSLMALKMKKAELKTMEKATKKASPQDKTKILADFRDEIESFTAPQPKQESKQYKLQQSITNPSYLDVVMRQDFEGFWSPSDKQLLAIISKDSAFNPPLADIKASSEESVETIWMTILVLIWLETVCENHKKAWVIIYQKGSEWLKEQGVDYESVKKLAVSCIKI